MSYPHFIGESDGKPIGRICREWRGEPPEIVTLCGSTKFKDEYLSEQLRLTLEGCLVISVGGFAQSDQINVDIGTNENPTDVKVMLDELHKRKIDIADRIHVINVGGYIGTSTRSEIEYAIKHRILVTYLEPLP